MLTHVHILNLCNGTIFKREMNQQTNNAFVSIIQNTGPYARQSHKTSSAQVCVIPFHASQDNYLTQFRRHVVHLKFFIGRDWPIVQGIPQ